MCRACHTPKDEALTRGGSFVERAWIQRSVTRTDIVNSNTGSKWLNDTFINFYMALWSQHAALRAQVRRREASAILLNTSTRHLLWGYGGEKWSQRESTDST